MSDDDGIQLPGPPPRPRNAPIPHVDVPNHLVPALLVTVFCCAPLGLVAVWHAVLVNTHLDKGDRDQAVAASREVRRWLAITAGAGLLTLIITIVVTAR